MDYIAKDKRDIFFLFVNKKIFIVEAHLKNTCLWRNKKTSIVVVEKMT